MSNTTDAAADARTTAVQRLGAEADAAQALYDDLKEQKRLFDATKEKLEHEQQGGDADAPARSLSWKKLIRLVREPPEPSWPSASTLEEAERVAISRLQYYSKRNEKLLLELGARDQK